MNKTLVRGIETFVLVALSGFLTDVAALHQTIDLSNPDSRAAIVTALLSGIGSAIWRYAASNNSTATTPPAA